MARPGITITLTERRGSCPCRHHHRPGDTFDFDTERGRLCPLAMHVAFLYADILRYGGRIPGEPPGTAEASSLIRLKSLTVHRHL